MTEEIIVKDLNFIEVMLKEDNIEVKIKYPKRSTLKKRFEMLDKIKEVLRRIWNEFIFYKNKMGRK